MIDEVRPFNQGARDGGPPAPGRRPPALARMRRHALTERAWRENKITDNLNAIWRRAYREFKGLDDDS
jgi:hypothetical protein